MSISEPIKRIADTSAVTISVAGTFGWWTGLIAFISSVLSLIWIAIRIYETRTFQKLLHGNQHTRSSDKQHSDDE